MINESRQPYTVSFLSMFFLVAASLLYLFSETFNPAAINNFFVMTFILVVGVVFAYLLVGVRFVFFFDKKRLFTDLMVGGVAFVALWLVSQLVPLQYGLTPVGQTTYAVMAAITEEWFFRLFLCAWIFKVTKRAWLAIPISSLVWAWFHLNRIVGADYGYIWLVFFAGLPLGYFTLTYRSADGSTLGHIAVNIIASVFK